MRKLTETPSFYPAISGGEQSDTPSGQFAGSVIYKRDHADSVCVKETDEGLPW